jgi:hypothetical protein
VIYSTSGKVQYLCGKCRSPEVLGPIVIYGQQSLVCGPCAAWMPWSSRIKVSVKRQHVPTSTVKEP